MGQTMTAKVNLASLKHVVRPQKGQDGMIDVIVIPIKANHLFKSDKGNIYLDLIAFEVENPKYDDTHIVKQSFPKEVRDAMTEEQKTAQPILGNLNSKFAAGEQAPGTNADAGAEGSEELTATDDLPF